MSDFLGNVAARILGTADVVRPRLPSIFEPQRSESALLPVAPSWMHGADADNVFSSRQPDTRERRQETSDSRTPLDLERRAESKTVPRQSARMQPAYDNFPDVAAESKSALHIGTEEWTRQRPEPPAARGRTAPAHDISSASRLAEAPRVSGFAPTAPRRMTQLERSSPEAVAAETLSPRRLARATPPSVRTFEKSIGEMTSPTGAPGFDSPMQDSSGRRAVDLSASVPSPAEPVSTRPGSHTASQRQVVATLPTPQMQPPATTTARPQPEPSVQVTIGRVEVRAIFPEASAARMPASRGRPTVSLDDYLKRAR